MRFRILDEETIQFLIDFLDDIQLQAAEDSDKVLLSFCQDMINELINADEVYDDDEIIRNLNKRSNNIDEPSYLDLGKIFNYLSSIKNFTDLPQEKGRKKRKKQEKEKPVNKKPSINSYMSLKEIKQFLIDDPELTNEERFDLYYEEYDRVQEEKRRKKEQKNSISYDKMLKDLNIEPYKPKPKKKK